MESEQDQANLAVAQLWCEGQGEDWALLDTMGRGGTAPVFSVSSPNGNLALKLYDESFSNGELGEESERRLRPQLELGLHDCTHLVRIHDGGRFENRLFVLMDQAPGRELEKVLKEIPRNKIRTIIDQVARAAIFLRQQGLCHRDIKSANIFISDDFETITLLDLSVLRNVHDPIGLGTDHGDQLPVVATSRYSPPEYLFRLIPAGDELWHALDIYQLGGILHDLIMREPMFEAEYQKNRNSNRYRFAWIVATQDPIIAASDVDPDLMLLAKRALDKNWERRSALRLEDFLDEDLNHQSQGLSALGANLAGRSSGSNPASLNSKLNEISGQVETLVSNSLRSMNITATHEVIHTSQGRGRRLVFKWNLNHHDSSSPWRSACFEIAFERQFQSDAVAFQHQLTLIVIADDGQKRSEINLPQLDEDSCDASTLATNSMTGLNKLSAMVLRA